MIKKVFFPSAFVTQKSAAAINSRIGRFSVYQPIMGLTPDILQDLSQSYTIELRHPVLGNESQLVESCRAYGRLGNLHAKDARRLDRLAADGFYNQDFAAELKVEVMKSKNGVAHKKSQKPDPLLNARVFLHLAQEFDLREAEIRQSLETSKNASRQLFEELRGESPAAGASGEVFVNDDVQAVMTEARLAAWALLSKHDTGAPDIFVTDSRAVMEAVVDLFPAIVSLEKIAATSDAETAERELAGRFRMIAESPWPGEQNVKDVFSYIDKPSEDGYVLEVYAIADFSSEKAVESFAGIETSAVDRQGGFRHTFFCCISKSA